MLALLPTATDGIVDALPVEQLTKELQRKRAERLARLNAGGEATGSELSSVSPSLLGDDGKSLSSEGFVHASQTAEALGEGAGAAATGLDGQQQAPLTEQQPESEQQSEQQQQQQPPPQPQPQQPQVKRNKTQLWNEVKISCECWAWSQIGMPYTNNDNNSHYSGVYSDLYTVAFDRLYSHSAQPSWPSQLHLQRDLLGYTC